MESSRVFKNDVRCSVGRFVSVSRWVSQSFCHPVNKLMKYFNKFVSQNKQAIRIRSSQVKWGQTNQSGYHYFWNETLRGLSGIFPTGTEANEFSLGAPVTDLVDLDSKPPVWGNIFPDADLDDLQKWISQMDFYWPLSRGGIFGHIRISWHSKSSQ
jgi:hypothetical protein